MENQTINVNEENQPSAIDASVRDLAEKLQKVMAEHTAEFSKEQGQKYAGGILPYLVSTGDGGVKPMAKVVILPIKEQVDEPKTEDNTGAEGEGASVEGGDKESSQS